MPTNPCSTNNAYFNCGEIGHFANKKQRQINFINMDGDTMYEETPPPKDRLNHIHADLAALSINKKKHLAKEMRIASAEDFCTV